jgi:formylglycine-generating enzyme
VAQKKPNGYGLYDVLGNVAEWTADCYGPYPTEAVADPRGPAEGEYHILRGGAAHVGGRYIRVSNRVARKPGIRGPYVGLRCAGD